MKAKISNSKVFTLLIAACVGLGMDIHQPKLLAQGTAFTYQGRLTDGGQAASGIYDFRFTIFDFPTGGKAIGGPITNSGVGVTNGLFTTALDFGPEVFTGGECWLEIAVRTNESTTDFTLLSPRQLLTPTPYAITASNLTGTLFASQLTGTLPSACLGGTYTRALTFNNAGNSFTGNGAGLTSLDASQLATGTVPDARLSGNVARTNQVWLLSGNAGTTPGTHFVGTTDNQPLELHVNRLRAFRLEDPGDSVSDANSLPDGAPNVIGGSPGNFVVPGVVGATIAGGGATNFMDWPYTNTVGGDYGTIGGGLGNIVAGGSFCATIGGGHVNIIGANVAYSVIAGGYGNDIAENTPYATIAGGVVNHIRTRADYSFIGGGYNNTIAANSTNATIAGGYYNSIGANSGRSFIGGGSSNRIGTNLWFGIISGGSGNEIGHGADGSAIGGGEWNNIGAKTWYGTIAGGAENYIGTNAHCSVIGGGWFNTNLANAEYATIPGGTRNCATNYAFAAGRRAKANHTGAFVWGDSADADIASTNANSVTMRASGGYRLFSNPNATAGVFLAPGGGSWTTMSDRNAKEDFQPVNSMEVLNKVAALPVTTWKYKSQDASIRHIGPTAQDFHAAFGLGETDTGITAIDADGVALAAIQGLNQKLTEELKRLDAENAELRRELAELKQLVQQLLK